MFIDGPMDGQLMTVDRALPRILFPTAKPQPVCNGYRTEEDFDYKRIIHFDEDEYALEGLDRNNNLHYRHIQTYTGID